MMGDNMIRLECYEMLKAMYNFDATLAKTLSFVEGDHFILHQTNTKQRNWWQVVNINGQVGFVPSNYVTAVKVEPQFMLTFLDECLLKLSDDSVVIPDKHELITRLQESKLQAEVSLKPYSKKQAPLPPPPAETNHVNQNGKGHHSSVGSAERQESVQSFHSTTLSQESLASLSRDDLPEFSQNNVTSNQETNNHDDSRLAHHSQSSPSMKPLPANSVSSGPVHTEEQLAVALYGMVEGVRRDTQLSHDLSRVAVASVLESLKSLLHPESSGTVWSLSNLIGSEGPLFATMSTIRSTPDTRRLRSALSALAGCAHDAQQRAWALHDDDHLISEQLQEVITVLSNADIRVSRDVLSTEHYEYVNALVLFYQMETRWHIRELLIQAFNVMCVLDREAVRVLCWSVLPREIARDMLANRTLATRLTVSAKHLTTMFSMGDPLPLSHFEQLDIDFVSVLLELIENPPDTDTEDTIPDQFLNLLLAFNIQFKEPESNMILDALQSRNEAKIFTEKLLLLLNREDDPVKVLDHQPCAPHSVLKLSLDCFSRRSIASLFYTNDTRVLLDITVRQLADLSPGDQRRGLYLQLCLGILRHTDYSHCHRQADLLRCFTRIFCEEGEVSRSDQNLVRTISNEFSQYFKA